MIQITKDKKGISLPLVIGLVTLLMVSSVAINSMVIRSMQSVGRIEASNRAYFAAEAGIEDALYELTPHFAGYETPSLGNTDARNNNFVSDLPCEAGKEKWCNEWEIESRSGDYEWGGRLYPNQKMMLYLFNDTHEPSPPATNAINQEDLFPLDIETLKNVSTDFSITFSIPDIATIFASGGSLRIDNDGDFDGSPSTVNEDPEEHCPFILIDPATRNTDCDGDGKVNEDSDKAPVILWRLTDGEGKSLIPIKGCLEVTQTDDSEICEIRFNPPDYSVTLDHTAFGRNQDGKDETIGAFINNLNDTDKARFEFLIIAPMEHIDLSPPIKKFEIPYIEYKIKSNNSDQIPYPFFRIKSDGYYRNFKQSISTIVTPKTTVPLFDFTIIQQQ